MSHADYLRRFLAEGKTEVEYREWSRWCGIKASHSYKDRLLCEQLGIDGVAELGQWAPVPLETDITLQQLVDSLLTECENPADLALCYLELLRVQPGRGTANDHTRDGFLCEHLGPFPKESFLRWGDRNWLPDVSRGWFRADGLPIDVQCLELSEGFGREITEDDVIAFVVAYRKGSYRPPHERLIRHFEDCWLERYGFRLTPKYAEHLGQKTGLLAQEPQPHELEAVPF